MANNRLYLVDTSTGEFICLAKNNGRGWNVGNTDLYIRFMAERMDLGDESQLLLGTENQRGFREAWLMDESKNYNRENTWEYPQDPGDAPENSRLLEKLAQLQDRLDQIMAQQGEITGKITSKDLQLQVDERRQRIRGWDPSDDLLPSLAQQLDLLGKKFLGRVFWQLLIIALVQIVLLGFGVYLLNQ